MKQQNDTNREKEEKQMVMLVLSSQIERVDMCE